MFYSDYSEYLLAGPGFICIYIGFIGPDDINYMCYILVIKY